MFSEYENRKGPTVTRRTMDGTLLWRRKGVLPHRIVTEIDDEDDEESDHRDLDQVSINDIIVAEPENDMEIGNEIKNVHEKVECDKNAPSNMGKHMEKEMHSIDIGQQLMPGRTRGQTREALAIAEKNLMISTWSVI